MAEETGSNRNGVPIGIRIIAFLWDYIIIFGYLAFLIGVSYPARDRLMPLFTSGPIIAELAGFLFVTLPVSLYFAICEGTKGGATWGKRRMGIVVTGRNRETIGLAVSLFRAFLKFLPWELAHFTIWRMILPSGYPGGLIYALLAAVYGLAVIYVVSPLWSKNRQTVYDSIAGTVVRYENENAASPEGPGSSH